MLTPMHQVTLSRVKALSALCVRKHVSPLCQPVSPLKTLHSLCTSRLCQRVTLFQEKHMLLMMQGFDGTFVHGTERGDDHAEGDDYQ